jgi:dTDP-4-amino-4,6-dideoxygalactose transaminase
MWDLADASKDAAFEALIREFKLPEPLFVTQPNLPRLEDYQRSLEKIWAKKWLTNAGQFHQDFERRLCEYLGVQHLSVFCNGTLALMVALQALRINSGSVITTPFTFPATAHVLHWNNIRPVFCDIDPRTYNLDPKRIEPLIDSDTKAILPVHCYGTPCDVEAIQAIADRHGLHVIYDAAHAFGVRYKGRALFDYGDMAMASFHATKLFTSIEGGALIVRNEAQRARINSLKNFGIADEETVIGPGINGKMNEFQAAFGLLQLDMVDAEIARRGRIVRRYRERLGGVPGLTLLEDHADTQPNYAYFPMLVDAQVYGLSRNGLYDALKRFNINTRKYFHPLCSTYSCYSALPSARAENLPVATRIASEVLCLPLYGALPDAMAERICGLVRELHAIAAG